MQKVRRFTDIGCQLCSFKDSGINLNLAEVQEQIREKRLFPYLKKQIPNLDISSYLGIELDDIEEYFYQTEICNSGHDFGINNDPLLLLITYCFLGVESDIKEI